ncbi:hypothetical protein J2847_006745 [Azospirillum agricola]|uniref:hypothetical protein n=1 Tax=Azospirillum agricola TaxID=1720247 RepID=UPI001F4923B7|nr:hypothetical protein [Azospirillum agricola]MBP2233407.1 hypothetical protein [Azospirillum agricola]
MASLIPARKVWAGGLSGVAVALLGVALRQGLGWDIPDDALSIIVSLVTPSVAYLVPPAARDLIVRADAVAREIGEGG